MRETNDNSLREISSKGVTLAKIKSITPQRELKLEFLVQNNKSSFNPLAATTAKKKPVRKTEKFLNSSKFKRVTLAWQQK
jgi:hypothetical protein